MAHFFPDQRAYIKALGSCMEKTEIAEKHNCCRQTVYNIIDKPIVRKKRVQVPSKITQQQVAIVLDHFFQHPYVYRIRLKKI